MSLCDCLVANVGTWIALRFQNWKDAVRNSIQLSFQPPKGSHPPQSSQAQGGRRNLNFDEAAQQPPSSSAGPSEGGRATQSDSPVGRRPLTRSAFTKTLLERELEMSATPSSGPGGSPPRASSPARAPRPPSSAGRPHHPPGRISVFDVRGLARLRETFSALDNSVKDIQMGREKGKNEDGINILAPDLVSHLRGAGRR